MDGDFAWPPHYDILQPVLLCEFKTQKTGSGWKKLKTDRVKMTKPRHYSQMCVYGVDKGFEFALYLATCKDDDDLHLEIVKLDHHYGRELIGKGHSVIVSPVPPRKIAASPAHFVCKTCPAKPVCWDNAPVQRNCRSCKYATAIENKEWWCSGYERVIPPDFIKTGCDRHESIATATLDRATPPR